jgi:uncharacterized protein (TIGR00725 family)
MIPIGVIGAGECSAAGSAHAYEVGTLIAQHQAVLICGGLGGIMESAARGARDAGGLTVGILPGFESDEANHYIDIPIVTGLSHARNILVVRSSRVLIAIEGGYGTLSEIAIALKLGKPVVGLNTWNVDPRVIQVKTAREAVEKALSLIKKKV